MSIFKLKCAKKCYKFNSNFVPILLSWKSQFPIPLFQTGFVPNYNVPIPPNITRAAITKFAFILFSLIPKIVLHFGIRILLYIRPKVGDLGITYNPNLKNDKSTVMLQNQYMYVYIRFLQHDILSQYDPKLSFLSKRTRS